MNSVNKKIDCMIQSNECELNYFNQTIWFCDILSLDFYENELSQQKPRKKTYLIKAIHWQQGNPGNVQALDNLLCHCCFATGTSSTNTDHKRLDLLPRTVVPWRSASSVNSSVVGADYWFRWIGSGFLVNRSCALTTTGSWWSYTNLIRVRWIWARRFLWNCNWRRWTIIDTILFVFYVCI